MATGETMQLSIIISAVDRFSTAFNTASAKISGIQGQLTGLAAGMRAVTAQLTMYAGYMAASFITNTAKIIAEFDHSLKRVQALSQATGEEMMVLEDRIRSLGQQTLYSSTEIAQAFGNMAMAGMNAGQMIAASADMINLATAASVDIADATTILLDISTPFKISMGDLTRVADAMTVAFTKSKADIYDLGEAMKYVSPAAAMAGYTMEETVATMAALAQAGYRGSMAGTGLRMAIRRMVDPTEEAKRLLAELGITLRDTTGQLKGFATIQEEIIAATDRLGRDPLEVFNMLFGARAGTTFAAIDPTTVKEYMGLISKMGGIAEQVATDMSKSFQGQLKIFKNAFQEAMITVGQEFMPVIIDLTYKLRDDFIPMMKDMKDPIKEMVVAFAGLAEVLLRATIPAMGVYGEVARRVSIVITSLLNSLLKIPHLIEIITYAWIGYKLATIIASVATAIYNVALLAVNKGLTAMIDLTYMAMKSNMGFAASNMAVAASLKVVNAAKTSGLLASLATASGVSASGTGAATILTTVAFSEVLVIVLAVVAALIIIAALSYLIYKNWNLISSSAKEFFGIDRGIIESLTESNGVMMRFFQSTGRLIASIGMFLYEVGRVIYAMLEWLGIVDLIRIAFKYLEIALSKIAEVVVRIFVGWYSIVTKYFIEPLTSAFDYLSDKIDAITEKLRGFRERIEESPGLFKSLGIDLASYQTGTGLAGAPTTGPAILHAGEIVLSPEQSDAYRRGGNISVGDINVYANSASDPASIAAAVREELERVLMKANRSAGYG